MNKNILNKSKKPKLNSLHQPETQNFDTLFSNSKIVSKKRNTVDLVNERPGSYKKYSNLKAYNSIPLLNNIKRYLTIDVMRETKNNKYELIIKKLPPKSNVQQKMKLKSSQNNQPLKTAFNTHMGDNFKTHMKSTLRHSLQNQNTFLTINQPDWKSLKTYRDRFHKNQNQNYRQTISSFTNRKISTAFQSYRKKQIHTHQTHRSNNISTSPVKPTKISDFFIEGTNTKLMGSPVWILNNQY